MTSYIWGRPTSASHIKVLMGHLSLTELVKCGNGENERRCSGEKYEGRDGWWRTADLPHINNITGSNVQHIRVEYIFAFLKDQTLKKKDLNRGKNLEDKSSVYLYMWHTNLVRK